MRATRPSRYDRSVNRHESAPMRQVGLRSERSLTREASGQLLAEGARFAEELAHLAPCTFIPKGVYRYKTHEEANRHQEDCLVAGMGQLTARRA